MTGVEGVIELRKGVFKVKSQTSDLVFYNVVKVSETDWECDCRAFLYHRNTINNYRCKHIVEVKMFLRQSSL